MCSSDLTKAPDDESEASSKIWKAYYGNHQNNPAFQKLQVGDATQVGPGPPQEFAPTCLL